MLADRKLLLECSVTPGGPGSRKSVWAERGVLAQSTDTARPRQVQGTVCCRLRLCTPGAGVGRSSAYTLRDAPDRRDAKNPEGLTSALRTHPESPASRPVACCSGAA